MGGLGRIRPCRLPLLTFMKGRMRAKSTRTAQLKWRMMLVLTTPGLRLLAITPAKPHCQRCAGVQGWGHRDPGMGRALVPRCHPTWSSTSSPKPSLRAGALMCHGTGATLEDVAIAGQESPCHGEHGGPRESLPGPRPLSPIVWPLCHGTAAQGGWDGQMALGCSPPWEPHGTAWHGTAQQGTAGHCTSRHSSTWQTMVWPCMAQNS